jgi:hypothetical protein
VMIYTTTAGDLACCTTEGRSKDFTRRYNVEVPV